MEKLIRFLKNAWRFRRELKTWESDDWYHTEELLSRCLKELEPPEGEPGRALKRCIDILDKRNSWFYQEYRLNERVHPEFTWRNGVLRDDLSEEDTLKNQEIINEALALKEADFDYLCDQIKIYHERWNT